MLTPSLWSRRIQYEWCGARWLLDSPSRCCSSPRRRGRQRAVARPRPLLRRAPQPDARELRRIVQLLPDHVPVRTDGDGGGWSVDYPRADVNLSIRLSELTKTRISIDKSGEPNHLVIEPDRPRDVPVPVHHDDRGRRAYIGDEEAAKLREYLLKGGFLWADDFWGTYAWDHWVNELSKVLPPHEYPIVDLPKDHPIFHSSSRFQVRQIPRSTHWAGTAATPPNAARTAPCRTRRASPMRTAA